MAEGQFTGKRLPYLYTSDAGESFLIRTDATLGGVAGTGLVPATTGNVGGATGAPKRFKPRGVYWQGTLGGRIVRKFLICNGGNDSTLYISGTPQSLTIDGVAGVTTGRRGEKASYAVIPTAAQ